MDLRTYLFQNRIKKGLFAEQLGISKAHLSRLVNGRMPSLTLAIKIEEFTDGAVKTSSWIGASQDREDLND